MIGSSVLDFKWIEQIEDNDNIMIVAEGITMYLNEEEIKNLITRINERFGDVHLLFDTYTKKGVKYSKVKRLISIE